MNWNEMGTNAKYTHQVHTQINTQSIWMEFGITLTFDFMSLQSFDKHFNEFRSQRLRGFCAEMFTLRKIEGVGMMYNDIEHNIWMFW